MGKRSKRATGKALIILIIVIMAVAPAFTAMTATTKRTQQTNTLSNPSNPIREGSPPTGISWAKTYGGNDFDSADSVQQTSDGGYIVAGNTQSFGAGWDDIWVLKLDSTGGVTWQKTYGDTDIDVARSIQQTSDGGYIVAGHTGSFGAGFWDVWVLKLDSTGAVTWQKTYGGPSTDEAWSVQQTSDGGYIVAGATYSFGAVSADFWVLKLDSTGGVTWQKTYGGAEGDGALSVRQTSDGGYVVAGETDSFGAGGYDVWVLKLNSTGAVTWQQTYGGAGDELAWSVQQTSDGGYIAAGTTTSFGVGSYDFWVLKLDSTGAVTWQKTYGGASWDVALSVQQMSDGGYIVAGDTNSSGVGSFDFWFLKLDSTGGVTWQKTYGGTGDDEVQSVQQTSDGGYIAVGYTTSFGAGSSDIWVLKLDSAGVVAFDGGIGASTQTTNVVPSNSIATVSTTSVTATNSAATVTNTAVTPSKTAVTRVWVQATPDTTPPSTITDLATGNTTNTSITLTWTAPGDDGMRRNATGYVVKYSTSGAITALNWTSATTYTQSWTPVKNGTLETHVVSGLTPETKYWFAVETYDKIPNYSLISNSPSGTTTGGGGGQAIPLIIILGGVGVAAAILVVLAVVVFMRRRIVARAK